MTGANRSGARTRAPDVPATRGGHYDRPVTDDERDLEPIDPADDAALEPTRDDESGPVALEYALRGAGTIVVLAAAVMFAVVEVFLVPFTVGGVHIPISAVLAVAINLSLPRLALWLVRLRSIALLPGLAWFGIVILATMPTSEGDLVIHDAWPGLVMLLAGSATVAVSGYRIVTGPLASAIKS